MKFFLAWSDGLEPVATAMPVVFLLGAGGNYAGGRVVLPAWLIVGDSSLTMGMALLSGLAALRSLRLVEPITRKTLSLAPDR